MTKSTITPYKHLGDTKAINSRLHLFRGLPGTGKSTRAGQMAAEYHGHHFEADQFFGIPYAFDPEKLKQAHAWCLEQTKKALNAGKLVTVSNTFSQLWEIQPYIELHQDATIYHCAEYFGSIHNVPEHSVKRMTDRWEHVPGETIIYPDEVMEALDYEVGRNDLDFADNYRAFRDRDNFLKNSFLEKESTGCCGGFETAVTVNGERWIVGCNFGH